MKGKLSHRLVVIQIFILFAAIVAYVLSRATFLLSTDYTFLEHLFGLFFFSAEIFVIFQGIGYFSNVLARKSLDDAPRKTLAGEEPSVAILIPARHEPREVVARTVLACTNLNYRNKTIYLLDDSSIPKYKEEARAIAEEYGVELFTRKDNRGAKAGIINDVCRVLDQKYLIVFDADQNPMPGFLKLTVPYLEADERLAFVQTPQFYTNTEAGPVALISNVQQAVFFEYICEGKSGKDSMFCCGTNFVLRKEALDDIGGFDENSVTEDVATTLKLHEKRWKSLYVNKAYTFGMAPENLGSYFMQQSRWAMGNIQLFSQLLKKFVTGSRALRPVQWFEYFVTSTYYFVGWAYLFLLAAPLMYLYFNVPSFFMEPSVYVLTFVPYFVFSIVVFYNGMKKRNYPRSTIFRAQMLGMITIPVYMRAAVLGLTNRKRKFQITPKDGARSISYAMLWPQLLFLGVHLSAVTWGGLRLYYEQSAAVAVNVLWVSYHFIMFCSIFYFNRK